MPRINEEMWKRHANPMSVWTRFAAIPAFALAAWSRVWLGWWSLVPSVLVLMWLVLNVFVFSPVDTPRSWASKGIYGERLWLAKRADIPAHYATIQRRLIVLGIAGMAMLAWGLIRLHLWLVVVGTVVLVLAQLWRIDRFSTLYETYSRGPSK
jgi:hypothetical protein